MSVQSYPLCWPQGFPRTKYRERGRFQTAFDQAVNNVINALRRFAIDSGKKVEHATLSSNMDLLNRKPDDPGVAVWFIWDGMQVCIPVDRYDAPASNVQAIYHIIEARRVELRHGTLSLVRATFTGFKALPPAIGKHWRDILKLPSGQVSKETINAAYRQLAAQHHPDRGGNVDAMAELNNARDLALQECAA